MLGLTYGVDRSMDTLAYPASVPESSQVLTKLLYNATIKVNLRVCKVSTVSF